jgi:hypothetical protein
MSKASSAAIGAAIVTLCLTVTIVVVFGFTKWMSKPYVPYTEIVYCDGEEIAIITAQTKLSAAHPHVDGDWLVWYKGKWRSQIRISHCQSVIIQPARPVTE